MIIRFRLNDYYDAMDFIDNNYIEPYGSLHYTRAYRAPGQQIYASGLRIRIPDANMSIREGICSYRFDAGEWDENDAVLIYPLDEKSATKLDDVYSNTTVVSIVLFSTHKNNVGHNPWCSVDTDEFVFDKPLIKALPPKRHEEIVFSPNQNEIETIDSTEVVTPEQPLFDSRKAAEPVLNSIKLAPNSKHSQENSNNRSENISFLSPEIVEYLRSIEPQNVIEDDEDISDLDLPCILRIHDQTGFEWLVIGSEYDEKKSRWEFELGFNNYWEDLFLSEKDFYDIADRLDTPLTAEIIQNRTVQEMMDFLDLTGEESYI